MFLLLSYVVNGEAIYCTSATCQLSETRRFAKHSDIDCRIESYVKSYVKYREISFYC